MAGVATTTRATSCCSNRTRRLSLALAIGVLSLGWLVVSAASARMSQASNTSQTHHVTIEGMRFTPQVLKVRRGDRVVWINKDPFPHTATADHNTFDSRSIEPNASWTYEARQPGDYDYGCTLHPTMKGRLSVQ
jgi:plastocyanin